MKPIRTPKPLDLSKHKTVKLQVRMLGDHEVLCTEDGRILAGQCEGGHFYYTDGKKAIKMKRDPKPLDLSKYKTIKLQVRMLGDHEVMCTEDGSILAGQCEGGHFYYTDGENGGKVRFWRNTYRVDNRSVTAATKVEKMFPLSSDDD